MKTNENESTGSGIRVEGSQRIPGLKLLVACLRLKDPWLCPASKATIAY